jgi:tetratricopeptide (TPR) repeat protein
MPASYLLIPLVLFVATQAALGQQSRPAPPALSEEDPALVRILEWQLERGETGNAEELLRANLTAIKPRLEAVLTDIDREFDILGRFGAVSIRFGPGYGDLEASNRRHEKLFELYRRLGGDESLYKRFMARKLRVEGAHYTNQGENVCGEQWNWAEAEKLYQLALERLQAGFNLAREMNDLRLMASSKLNMGSALIRLGKGEEGIAAYNEGMRYAQQMPGDLYKGLLNLNLGNTYVWTGDPDKSLSYSQEALAIFRRIGRGTWEANALMNLGNAYLRRQNFASAWETLNLALEVARKNGEYRVYGRALLNLGMAGVQLKKADAIAMLEEALEWYRNDREIYPSIEREVVLQDGLRLISQVARQVGDTATAEKYDQQFMELINQNPDRYGELRASPCFAIYQARPMPSKSATASRPQP